MANRIVVFGATGYTGGLVVESLLRRGVKPVLAGRSSARLAALASASGGLEYRVADVGNPASLAGLVGTGDVLVSTVGPFAEFGHPAARAAAEAGAHYVDSTGEVGFVRELVERHDGRARDAGAVMVPAFGYDYVPGNLAAALAARDGGVGVRELEIGYFVTGSLRNGLSHGTRKTMAQGLTLPAPVWHRGRLDEEVIAARVCTFATRGGAKDAVLVPGTEALFLPAEIHGLDSVSVYNGSFGKFSRAMRHASRALNVAAALPFGRAATNALARLPVGGPGGPDEAQRARVAGQVVAVARDATGAAVAQVELSGPNPYTLTGDLMAWAAQRLADGAGKTPGVVGPVAAFGLDELTTGCASLGLVPV